MPTALIVGAFGQGNPGDEALLAGAVAAVQANAGWDAVVATAQPAAATARLGVEAVDATAASTTAAAVRADALVVGGGTVFKELAPQCGRPPGSLLRRATALAGLVAARRRPVALLGVGAAEIRHPVNRRLARRLASRADLLVLRDAASAQLLAAMGAPAPLRVGADLAWLTVPDRSARRRDPAAPVGVALSHLAGGPDLLDRLGTALAHAAGGRPIELEPWQGSPVLSADARAAARVQRLVAGATVVAPPDDLGEATDRMRTRSAVVALRFHAAVAAAAAGTPFVAVAHEPKLAAIAARLGQAAVAVDATAPALAAALEHTLAGPPPDPASVAEERRRAAATAELLGLLLTGEGDGSSLTHLTLVPDPVPA